MKKDQIINQLNFLRHMANGAEYWLAREMQSILGYSEWRNFENAIERAKASCVSSGKRIENHFVDVTKMVPVGSDSKRQIKDIALSRFACYLIAMNGDPSKPEVASAQEYFAIQTRKSELALQIEQARQRIDERDFLTANQKKLYDAARAVGVERFGKFQNAGYKAMYGGMDNQEVKAYKGIEKSDALFDRISRAELAAHNFRSTQAETRLIVEKIDGEEEAINVHAETGKLVRQTMKQAGGTLPEDLPIEPHIKNIRNAVAKYVEVTI